VVVFVYEDVTVLAVRARHHFVSRFQILLAWVN